LPVKHVIIGTAGHVDHGKTELVKALTGHDTDRLEEEKKRGISIVLGFAPLDLGEGLEVGVIDVPGHERFVKNMVSGAVGVDVALVVVAADEGVMPQTEEHLEVLRLLGVRRGVIAITKIDLADDEIADVVESEAADLIRGTSLEGFTVIRTSAAAGEGIGELRAALASEAAAVIEKARGDFFRMPVDRVFTKSGIGTVVTGTTWGGVVRTGDELVVEPGGRKVRVREVQSFECDIDSSAPGMRTALALHGVKVGEIHSGDQLLTPGFLSTSGMLDVRLETGRSAGSKLRNRQRVRFHHAGAEVLARVILLESDEMGPEQSGFAQMRLEKPVAAMGGDRFVIRSYSPMRTVAGGIVIDPVPDKAKRFRTNRIGLLATLHTGDPPRMIEALADEEAGSGIPPGRLSLFGIGREEAERALAALSAEGTLHTAGGRFYHRRAVERYERKIYELLGEHTTGNGLVWGMDREELRARAGLSGEPLFDFLLEKGAGESRLFFKGGKIRAGSSEIDLSSSDKELVADIKRIVSEAGYSFPLMQDLAARTGQEDRKLLGYLKILQEAGDVVRVPGDGYISAAALEAIIEGTTGMLGQGGSMSVGDFKERFGLTRKYAVPLLEYLDGKGYTKREDDSRVAGPALGADRGDRS
jgi:selenocysteine-specific elongation factor